MPSMCDFRGFVDAGHLMSYGADIRELRQNAYRDEQARGFIDFLGLFTGNSLAELLLCLPTDSGGAHLDNCRHVIDAAEHR